jgi:hypothetical protein
MHVRIAVLADFASLTIDQKLNVLGVFRTINSTQAPVQHPQFKLILQLEFNSSETGTRQIKIELVDEDGKEMFSISGVMTIERPPDGSNFLINQILDFAGLSFPKFGDYEFRILLDGTTITEVPLSVKQITAPPAGI